MSDSPATIEREADSRQPGRTAFRVTGPTWHAVQHAIDDILNASGVVHGEFRGPSRVYGRFAALGFTLSALPVAAE